MGVFFLQTGITALSFGAYGVFVAVGPWGALGVIPSALYADTHAERWTEIVLGSEPDDIGAGSSQAIAHVHHRGQGVGAVIAIPGRVEAIE